MSILENRRKALAAVPLLVIAGGIAACSKSEEEVGATEDLMREHGVLRRAVLVFRESAIRLRQGHQVDARALHQTAALFRRFGEDYHERRLEEAYIFPALRRAGGPGAAYVDTLIAQHDRGREIINYLLGATGSAQIADATAAASAMEGLERMYANHAAREDTVVFPAWKKAIGADALGEMGEKFEDIEKQQFGGDGFDMAVKQIGDIESTLGFADLARFTAAPPGSP